MTSEVLIADDNLVCDVTNNILRVLVAEHCDDSDDTPAEAGA